MKTHVGFTLFIFIFLVSQLANAQSDAISTEGLEDGVVIEYIYRRTVTSIRPPIPASARDRDEYFPPAWSDDPEEITAKIPYLWISYRIGLTGSWSAFSTPKLIEVRASGYMTNSQDNVLESQVKPDLIVYVIFVETSPFGIDPGGTFTLSAWVRNDGDEASAATTLRYYQSTDATITTSDTEVGTDAVAALAASGSSTHSVELTAPTTPGTYYYGACVDVVAEESDTTNNCLGSVQVDVLESQLQSQGHPDLVVGPPSVNDDSPNTGGTFTLSATVQNVGDGDAASTTLRFYRSTNATITTFDTEVGTDAVVALAASGSSTHSVELTAPTTPGTYYYGACVDPVAEESNTTNNCLGSVQVDVLESQGHPDLVVLQSVSDSNPAAIAQFTLSATVRNIGDGDAASTTLRFYRSADATITTSDTEVGTDAVAALVASGSSTHSVELTTPTTPGTYYYGACVDPVAEESDTTNNCFSSLAVTVTLANPLGSADLTVASPSVSDSNPAAGAQFTFSVTVRNIGVGDAASTTLRYYRSADATITTSDTEVGTDTVAALVASGSSTHSVELTAPTTPGMYYYGACVDPVAEESDTTNNCLGSVQVGVLESQLQSQGHPDLVVLQSVSDSNPAAGAQFTFSATVQNVGDGDAASTTLRYYRSVDATITTSDTEVGTDAVAALVASGSSYESVTLSVPLTPGTYYYSACVDAVAGESDTTNNCSGSVRVDVEDPTLPLQYPDLVVLQSVSDSNLGAGAKFTFSATVWNVGDGDAATTTLRYYRSTDATITTSDTEVGTDAVAALVASASSYESVTLSAPSTPGTYYYGACVDAVASESDTTNNCSGSVRVDVEDPTLPLQYPDLVVLQSVSDSNPAAGAQFTFSATVWNVGDGDAATTTLRYYRSADATITTSDTEVGTDAVAALVASGSSYESVTLSAPSTPGTYYYGACVDAVGEEYDTANNCSSSVSIMVMEPPPEGRVLISPSKLVFRALGQTATVSVRILDGNGAVDTEASFEVDSVFTPHQHKGGTKIGSGGLGITAVDGGLEVTANETGDGTIYINSPNAQKAILNVIAIQDPVSLKLSPSSVSLAIRETATLRAQMMDANGHDIVLANNNQGGLVVYWRTSDPAVATVKGNFDFVPEGEAGDTATVTAVGAGTATVKGSHRIWKDTATVTVTDN